MKLLITLLIILLLLGCTTPETTNQKISEQTTPITETSEDPGNLILETSQEDLTTLLIIEQ
ncbi:MAG: hypothetical protein Q7R56_01460 [Nanoarchaeota archaeon]|nr:hypothetical protein [Nanoarchaeota archaeon]